MFRIFNWCRSLDATIGYHGICFGAEVQKSLMITPKKFSILQNLRLHFSPSNIGDGTVEPRLTVTSLLRPRFLAARQNDHTFSCKRTLDITSQIFLAHF